MSHSKLFIVMDINGLRRTACVQTSGITIQCSNMNLPVVHGNSDLLILIKFRRQKRRRDIREAENVIKIGVNTWHEI